MSIGVSRFGKTVYWKQSVSLIHYRTLDQEVIEFAF